MICQVDNFKALTLNRCLSLLTIINFNDCNTRMPQFAADDFSICDFLAPV